MSNPQELRAAASELREKGENTLDQADRAAIEACIVEALQTAEAHVAETENQEIEAYGRADKARQALAEHEGQRVDRQRRIREALAGELPADMLTEVSEKLAAAAETRERDSEHQGLTERLASQVGEAHAREAVEAVESAERAHSDKLKREVEAAEGAHRVAKTAAIAAILDVARIQKQLKNPLNVYTGYPACDNRYMRIGRNVLARAVRGENIPTEEIDAARSAVLMGSVVDTVLSGQLPGVIDTISAQVETQKREKRAAEIRNMVNIGAKL